MNQIRAKHSVTVVPGRGRSTGKHPVLQMVFAHTDVQRTADDERNSASLEGGYIHAGAFKTHIGDTPAALHDLLAEDFERGVIALRTRLESEYA